MKHFASYRLELRSALHLGSRRVGIVAQTHRHAPGHLFSHALAAAAGAQRGTTPEVFAQTLEEIRQRFRFGPAFFMEGERRLDDDEVEQRLISSSHHVTLDPGQRCAVESALFEIECLNAPRGIQLAGGVWLADDDRLDGEPLQAWLSRIRLGGELKTGFGRVACCHWQADAKHYPGIGPASPAGVLRQQGELLPGAAVDGVEHSPLLPWLGRRHDPRLGFGRQLSKATLIHMNGRASASGSYLPDPDGCWQPAS